MECGKVQSAFQDLALNRRYLITPPELVYEPLCRILA